MVIVETQHIKPAMKQHTVGMMMFVFLESLLAGRSLFANNTSVEAVQVLPLLPIEHYIKLYQDSKAQFHQPTAVHIEVTPKPISDCYQCGSVKSLDPIMQGKDAPIAKFPWQALLLPDGHTLCGGTLIAAQWVLTAAHCINSSNIQVYLGARNIFEKSRRVVIKRSTLEVIHPDYKRGTLPHDIALIKLDTPVVFTDYIKPACLPTPNQDFEKSPVCYVTGWGRTTGNDNRLPLYLQEIPVKFLKHKYCFFRYLLAEGRAVITQGQICTTMDDEEGSPRGVCSGDSGGPLSCQLNGVFYVVGVVSAGEKGCEKTFLPDLFTRVSFYRDWIKAQLLKYPDHSHRHRLVFEN